MMVFFLSLYYSYNVIITNVLVRKFHFLAYRFPYIGFLLQMLHYSINSNHHTPSDIIVDPVEVVHIKGAFE